MSPRKPFLLRIDPKLWEELEIWSRDELRSVNGQIEYILKQAVAKRRGAASKQTSEHPVAPDSPPADARKQTGKLS